jgi:hypothetical protein
MPEDLQEIRDRIVNTIALVNANFLDKLWDKLEYRLDVCRMTRGQPYWTLLKKREVLNAL